MMSQFKNTKMCLFLHSIKKRLFSESVTAEKPPGYAENRRLSFIDLLCESSMCRSSWS